MGRLVYGVHKTLEEAANEMLRQSLQGVTSQEAKKDILTPWKEKDRASREILVAAGTPDAAFRLGMYHRAYNSAAPHLNSRDGVARGLRIPRDLPLASDSEVGREVSFWEN